MSKDDNKTEEVICTFKALVKADIPENEISRVQEAANLHFLGTKHCNKSINGKLVEKFPNHPNKKQLDNVHWSIRASHQLELKFELLSNGVVRIKK